MVFYFKSGIDDILQQTKDDYVYVHSCNAYSSWDDGGIDYHFKKWFPDACKIYKHWCRVHNYHVAGKCLLVADRHHIIGNLVTSNGVTLQNDNNKKINSITHNAIRDLLQQISVYKTVISPSHNNELFGMQMERTVELIQDAMNEYGFNIEWRIYVID
jgi:hypothetical protein